jgi:hypothetical protein
MGYREYQQSWEQIKEAKSSNLFSNLSILVVQGCFDHAERVLESAQIEFELTSPGFNRPLDKHDILIINCPGEISGKNAKRIRKFVENGGFLISTDWALEYLIERTFPNTIAYNGSVSGGTVKLRIVNNTHPFTKSLQGTPTWEIDAASHRIRVLGRKAEVLAVSEGGLVKKNDPLIVSFEWGSGRVLHMISHVYLQSVTLQDTFASAMLLSNVMENKALSKGFIKPQPAILDLSRIRSTPLVVDSRPEVAVVQTIATARGTCPAGGDLIVPNQSVYSCPSCRVQFHEKCIRQYLKQNQGCPICKRPIRI